MTKQVTLVFPGQGAQFVGMGKELSSSRYFSYFDKADEVLGFKLSDIIFNGPEEELKLTANTQPAILTLSYIMYLEAKDFLDANNIKICNVLGHSLGEYSALTAAGVFSFEDAVKTVHFRGKFMQEAVPVGVGKMCAILKIPQQIVENVCSKVSTTDEVVVAANYNSPLQVVISGHKNAVERAVKLLEQDGGKAVELSVSAPFHSPLMSPAKDKLKNHLNSINVHPNIYPYIANIDAEEYPAKAPADTIKGNLIEQLTGGVMWTQSIQKLADNATCIEVGPGKVLSSLIKKINPKIEMYQIANLKELKPSECTVS